MNEKIKNISGILFLAFLLFGMVGSVWHEDQVVSYSERRNLMEFPELSFENLMKNDYSDSLETYLQEQFIGRDLLRTIKTEFDTKILRKTDSNGYVKIENHLFEIHTTYDESQVANGAEKFQDIATTYFKDANIYYSIIPDKNYFMDSIPQYDYESVSSILEEMFVSGTEIEVWDTLELDSYYYTDLHVRQEALIPLANQLLNGMASQVEISLEDYEMILATDTFYGGYSANSAYPTQPDALYYLENNVLRKSIVYDYESNTNKEIYSLDKLGGMDDYDMYLGGARALLSIKNTQIENGKKLIIFRDSFGSSIAPLLIHAYEEIVLVDLRYVSADYGVALLEEETYDDVLFLYQVQVLYNSNSMK